MKNTIPDPYVPGWLTEPVLAWTQLQFVSRLCADSGPFSMMTTSESAKRFQASHTKKANAILGIGFGDGTIGGGLSRAAAEASISHRKRPIQMPRNRVFGFKRHGGMAGLAERFYNALLALPLDSERSAAWAAAQLKTTAAELRKSLIYAVDAGVVLVSRRGDDLLYSIGDVIKTLPAVQPEAVEA